MKLCFTLSMPSRGSWNGRWSGENDLYARIVDFSKKDQDKVNKILENRYYSYRWNDGWSACITVKEVDSIEARKIKKKSSGFCGYDWMIKNIISHQSCADIKELSEN